MKKLLYIFLVFNLSATFTKAASGNDVRYFAVHHASFVISTGRQTIFVDPTGSAEQYANFRKPDIILITHEHPDHFDKELIEKLKSESTIIIAPAIITSALNYGRTIRNGETYSDKKIKIEAIPMYNMTPDRLKYHKKGIGNGYVLTLNNRRIYISGDTEDIPEMLRLKNIDDAFVCMNLPYTMSADQAAKAVLSFRPTNVYPYHFRTQGAKLDETINTFKNIVAADKNIHVQLLKWYENEE